MKCNLLGINIDILNKIELLNKCSNYFNTSKINTIYFFNSHCYNISRKNPRYLDSINNANLLLNDGIGIKIALKMFGINEKENMNGTDLIPQIIELAYSLNKNIYLLGGKPGIVEKVEKKLNEKYLGCNIVGKHNGYFKKEETNEIIRDILNSKTDLLIVGMGVPYQELWIENNKVALSKIKIVIAGGAILDFLSGDVRRAPKILRKLNLEWTYRLLLEPKRLWKRYLIGNIKFLISIITNKYKLKMKY